MMGRWILAVVGPLAVSGVLVRVRDDFAPPNAALVLVLVVLAQQSSRAAGRACSVR